MEQVYKIAGLTVKMDSFGRAESQAIPYLTSDSEYADIIIQSDWTRWKQLSKSISDGSCEYLATGDSFYRQLMKYDGLMIHASAVVMDNRAYLFSAPCGTGKSTHTSLWRRVFGDKKVRMLNDDKPALRLEQGVWYAYGTPWCGKTGQNANLRVPVAGLAMLERGIQNNIVPFKGINAVQAILSQTTRCETASERIRQLELIDLLMNKIQIWKMQCNMEPEAAIVAYEAMSGEKWRNENET